MKTWSISDASKMMEVPKSWVKHCLKNNILKAIKGRVTQESLDKYFEEALFTPEEAADALQIEVGIIEDCIKDGFLPTYQAWNSTLIRSSDLDKLDAFITAFLEYEEKEKERQKKLQQEINTRHKWIANSQGNLCFICNKTFSKPPADWMSRELNGNLEVHAICEVCVKQQTKNN